MSMPSPEAARPSSAAAASGAAVPSGATAAAGGMPPDATTPDSIRRTRGGRWKALMVLAICAAPVIASYLTYYFYQPEGRTNYGELILPQRPVGDLAGKEMDGAPAKLADFSGKWLMLMTEAGACEQACERRLYLSRQVRTTAGKDMDRVERVLLLTGNQAPSPELLAQHPGLHVLRVPATQLSNVLGTPAVAAVDHIFMVDPLSHLMMRFPADVDPNKMKKDLAKLLRASRIG